MVIQIFKKDIQVNINQPNNKDDMNFQQNKIKINEIKWKFNEMWS